MISTSVIPVSTATEQELLVEISEKVCRPYCVNASIQPSANAVFNVVSTQVLNGNAVATVEAKVTVVTPSMSGCGCAHTQVFTERFDVGFNASGDNNMTLAAGSSQVVSPAMVKCCKASGIKLVTSLTASIA